MKRNQNLIIFSAGETKRSGKVDLIKNALRQNGIDAFDWKELFGNVHNENSIALLPSLLKKIPTFDFALVFAECVDNVKRREVQIKAMRDNVVFELGMCITALGVDKVILLADENLHIPDDLFGVGKIGIERITFSEENNFHELTDRLRDVISEKSNLESVHIEEQLNKIINHVRKNATVVDPVFVGAAVSSAEAYFLNFIVRFFENTNKVFYDVNEPSKKYTFPKKIKMQIVFPEKVNSDMRQRISRYYEKKKLNKFVIEGAGTRGLFFDGVFKNDTLTVIDVPTSVSASYVMVNTILNIDADDDFDKMAETRFLAKEMDMYEYALKKLLEPKNAEKRLNFLTDEIKKQNLIEDLKSVKILRRNI